jgi:uroporphyrinogen-III decarboxylase
MAFVTDATIRRIQAWRAHLGLNPRPACGSLADDAIQFLSVKSYRDYVLPYHKRILEALWGEGPHFMHLCGNVQRHFPTLIGELNMKGFDTGYPIRFDILRAEIGEDVEIQGGIQVADLIGGTPEQVFRKSAEILSSGIRQGGRFIYKEANNLPPMVPITNLAAMYAATKEYGTFNA